MVAGKIKKLLDVGKKAKNVIKMTPAEIARRKKHLERLKWLKKKKTSTISSYKLDDKRGPHDTRLKDHDDHLKSIEKEMKEKDGWNLSKGGSVTKQRRLSKRGWGVTKRK